MAQRITLRMVCGKHRVPLQGTALAYRGELRSLFELDLINLHCPDTSKYTDTGSQCTEDDWHIEIVEFAIITSKPDDSQSETGYRIVATTNPEETKAGLLMNGHTIVTVVKVDRDGFDEWVALNALPPEMPPNMNPDEFRRFEWEATHDPEERPEL